MWRGSPTRVRPSRFGIDVCVSDTLSVSHILDLSEQGKRMPNEHPDLASLATVLWRAAPARGNTPRTRLSVDLIVEAGIAIADAEGLDAVSMQRVAAELGYTTMALYRHVPGKPHLLTAMADSACGAPPEPGGDAGWRADVEAWADALWAVYARHPWAVAVPTYSAPLGPGELAWFEALLEPLARTGLPDGELVALATFLSSAVRDLARVSLELAPSGAEYGLVLASRLDPARFPLLCRMTGAAAFESDDGDLYEPLRTGLARLLDGVASAVPPPLEEK